MRIAPPLTITEEQIRQACSVIIDSFKFLIAARKILILMNYSIKNDHLKISIQEKGAELCEIQSTVTGRDYLWDANPDVWASHAPVLFPVIGAIKTDSQNIKEVNMQCPATE
jgi:hypothetical protein